MNNCSERSKVRLVIGAGRRGQSGLWGSLMWLCQVGDGRLSGILVANVGEIRGLHVEHRIRVLFAVLSRGETTY